MPRYRMIHVDHYMCRPVVPFDDLKSDADGRPISKVPVIRIFGADADGRKICLHVHGFYPYIAIQNRGPQDGANLSQRIITDIERSIRQNVQDNNKRLNEGQGQSRAQGNLSDQDEDSNLVTKLKEERTHIKFLSNDLKHPIHRIENLRMYNYYGYHNEEQEFFKIYLYNPRMVKQIAQLCEDCKILNRFVAVFWAHLPYILLFFIDNNLRGMQYVDLDQLYWRKGRTDCDTNDVFLTDIEPTSSCELEADIRYEWILNRSSFGSNGNDDALKELWLDDQAPTQVSSSFNPTLPMYELERSYIQQLCDSYDVDFTRLDIEVSEQPESSQMRGNQDNMLDSDESLQLGDNEECSRPDKEQCIQNSHENDDFSDDEIFTNLSNIEKNKIETNSDEFSDDDQVFLEALTKAETENPSLKSMKSETHDSPSETQSEKRIKYSDNSMIDGRSVVCPHLAPTPRSLPQASTSSRENISHEYQYICLMSMEIHTTTRDKLKPDPAFDPIEAVFYCIRNDVPDVSSVPAQSIGIIITDPFTEGLVSLSSPLSLRSPGCRSNISFAHSIRSLLDKTGFCVKEVDIEIVNTELELIMKLVDVVRTHDPEILLGYEMEQLSWGYVLERASILNINISGALSRVGDNNFSNNSRHVESNYVQPIMFTGRMVFSTWRIIRHEIHLNTCSFEKIYHHTLNERVPCFDFDTLTNWFNQNRNRWRVLNYYLIRVVGQMKILDKFDLITKVSELARVYGTQFIDVITRGSQIGIESMMLRLAKLQNLAPLSPTVMQRNKMRAPEALPLVMEPETNIYYDPVAVLDFQSLYPSIVIAYNYCYSTCLGRVTDLEAKGRHNFGCGQLNVDEQEVVRLLKSNSVHVSPCGVAFVKKHIRHGVLPKMLSELITTRAMVKDQMKKNMKSGAPNRRLQRILDHRQHGLKMMANTTYGYTGASYTGRMPCVEIADSIVSKGREALEKAIELVEGRAEWGARVIYGDTDSMFIQFRNCDRNIAFKRAFEMVDAITASNPYPIKMKFEKIYQPCVLQTKKRYCGFKYENPEQAKPEFEAKGIETVRRDCCPAAAKMLEMALRIQFETRNIDEVKRYAQCQFEKIMSGKLSNIQDFIFARQYKPRSLDKSESVFVPAWQIARRFMNADPRAEPRLNERVPFVIIYGEPRTQLVNLAKTPIEILQNLAYRVNADYYIQKIICPTLNRVFCTLQTDTLLWYKTMTHQNVVHRSHYLVAQSASTSAGGGVRTMSQYFSPSHCPVCAKSIPLNDDICSHCHENLQSSVVRLTEEVARNQRKLFAHRSICRACASLERGWGDGSDHDNPCISYDCANLFRYHQAKLDALNCDFLSRVLKSLN